MAQKIGYQYHNLITYQRQYSAAEEQHLFDHFKAIQPGAALFLDNDGRAEHAKALVPSCAVVVRGWRADEGNMHETLTPQACFDLYKNTPKGLIRNIMNEPNSYKGVDFLKGMSHWLAQVMDLFGDAGIPIVTPNFGEGHPDIDHLDALEELWVALDKWHDLHFYSGHEYGSHLGMLFNVGGKFDMTPWRVGRFESFVLPYLQKHGHKTPNVILTEAGCDSAHDGTNYRGWKSCWTEKQYFDEMQAAVAKIYSAPHYVGLCLFSYGNTGQQFTESDWATFDLSQASEFQTLLEAYAEQKVVDVSPKTSTSTQATVATGVPKPDNAGVGTKVTVLIRSQYKNLRSGPGTNYTDDGDINSGEALTVFYATMRTDANGGKWVWVEDAKDGAGWMTTDGVIFNNVPTKPIPPVTPAPVVTQPAPVAPVLPDDSTPITIISPQPRTFTYMMQIQVTAETEIAAEKVAEFSVASARNAWLQFVQFAKLGNDLSIIKDASFVLELPSTIEEKTP